MAFERRLPFERRRNDDDLETRATAALSPLVSTTGRLPTRATARTEMSKALTKVASSKASRMRSSSETSVKAVMTESDSEGWETR